MTSDHIRAVSEYRHGADSPALHLHLREIGKYKSNNTLEGEIDLYKRMKVGDDSAREELINSNLCFVVQVAKAYVYCGLPLLDLIAAGNVGLMKAVKKFDPITFKAKLITYADYYIRQEIRVEIARYQGVIRMPQNIIELVRSIKKADDVLTLALHRSPTDEELADELDISRAKVARWRMGTRQPISLSQTVGFDEDHTVADHLWDENAVAPDDAAEHSIWSEKVKEMMTCLTERQNAVLTRLYGLDGNGSNSFRDVARALDLTTVRIRQIEHNAIRKLRKVLNDDEMIRTLFFPDKKIPA